MRKAFLCAAPILALVAAGLPADDEKREQKDGRDGVSAVVVKVDAQKHSVTVRFRDADGKEAEKTFAVGDDTKVTDEAGRAAGPDALAAGDEVIVVEKGGRAAELRRAGRAGGPRAFDADRFLERFDKNKNGTIEREELPARYRRAFDQLDTNKDGKLSREELEKGAASLQRPRRPADVVTVLVEASDCDEGCAQELQYMYDLLRKLDKDGSGKLDPALLKAARERLLAGRVDEILQDLDDNGDGKISREEARGRVKRDFDKIDLNKDGFIDREELLKAAAERAAESATPPKAPGERPSDR